MARVYGKVTLRSDSPRIESNGILIAAPEAPLPRPKYEAIERYGFYDLPKYAGQQPYQLILRVRYGDGGDSQEDEIRALERLTERPEGRDAPPEVTVAGPVPHRTLRWRITNLDEDTSRTKTDAAGARTLFVVTVTLEQRVTDTILDASLKPTKKSKGIGITTTVKSGEDSLYDVAQRYYHDSSFAIAISKANPVRGNPMPLGARLRTGQTLKLP
jgi:hypothetical protein